LAGSQTELRRELHAGGSVIFGTFAGEEVSVVRLLAGVKILLTSVRVEVGRKTGGDGGLGMERLLLVGSLRLCDLGCHFAAYLLFLSRSGVSAASTAASSHRSAVSPAHSLPTVKVGPVFSYTLSN
jgi:hypothetical protein